jgi:lipoprotein-anchoring transpeptidase ErfK/SrfK
LRIVEKIGEGLPIGTVFRSRAPTKDVWSSDPSNPLSSSTDDLVLSRILWLGGAEAQNANTRGRYVYIHGTNHENLLGQPASHGCIRMSNTDVIELFDLVEVGNEVDVTAGGDEVA